jgi:hypothetical protein
LAGKQHDNQMPRSPQKPSPSPHRHHVAQLLDSHLNPRDGSDEGRVAVHERPLLGPDAGREDTGGAHSAEKATSSSQRKFAPSFSWAYCAATNLSEAGKEMTPDKRARAAWEEAKRETAAPGTGGSGDGGL